MSSQRQCSLVAEMRIRRMAEGRGGQPAAAVGGSSPLLPAAAAPPAAAAAAEANAAAAAVASSGAQNGRSNKTRKADATHQSSSASKRARASDTDTPRRTLPPRTARQEASAAAASPAVAAVHRPARPADDSSSSSDAGGAAPAAATASRRSDSHTSKARRRMLNSKLATRPFYSSEEEDAAIADGSAGAMSTDAEQEEADVPPAAAAAADAASSTGASTRRFQRRLTYPHVSLTHRLLNRSGPPLKQWSMPLAQRTGELLIDKSKRAQEAEEPGGAVEACSGGAYAETEAGEQEPTVKLEHPAVKPEPKGTSDFFSRPFDIVNSMGTKGAASSAAAASAAAAVAASSAPIPASSADAAPPRYWSYHASGITKHRHSPGYTVTDHAAYTDRLAERASPPLTASELASLTPVSAEEACRENGLTLTRHQRCKLSDVTRAQVMKCMKGVTGEIDRKVLALCDHGTVNKCHLYRTDDYNITLLSTDRLLSGEPIGAWMGTLRTRRTFAQRVGMEQSLAHIWAYETRASDMPESYTGPDLVHDGTAYGNETHFLRDPKWSHQRADANIASRLVWHQKSGMPYIAFVTLGVIEPHAELFIDWGDKCWKNVWRTQLTALATHSHRQHCYLKSLQHALAARRLNVLPQLPHSRFSKHPPPENMESADQKRFLDAEIGPFAVTSAVTLGQVKQLQASREASPEVPSVAPSPLLPDAAAAASPSPPPARHADDTHMTDALAAAAAAAASSLSPPSAAASIPAAAGDVVFDHAHADAAAAGSGEGGSADSSCTGSTPSSPFTPSFNTHKAFCASTSHTMLTVFASALLHENRKELARIARRLYRYRMNRYRRPPRARKPLLEGAMHVAGQHTFELLRDPQVAFIKSGTRCGREAKVDVSEHTKRLIDEAFQFLRPEDFPDRKDEKIIRQGNVPKAAIYEVVGLKHPARFFTRPDQSAFSLVCTKPYARGDPIGTYIGVFRDFEKFHQASDADATKQVYAYDCMAAQIPGPPNPFLSPEEKARPLREQLCYRGGDLVVESLYYGNEVRFMNDAYGRSSADAAVNASACIVWDRERHWPCILIRALHSIARGDEIICDYGDEFWNKVARSLMMDHAKYGDEMRALIQDTEEWCRVHGVPLPPKEDKLPLLFTQNRETDKVVYPLAFLADAAAADGTGGGGGGGAPEDGGAVPVPAESEDPSERSDRMRALQQGLEALEQQQRHEQQHDEEPPPLEEHKQSSLHVHAAPLSSHAPSSLPPSPTAAPHRPSSPSASSSPPRGAVAPATPPAVPCSFSPAPSPSPALAAAPAAKRSPVRVGSHLALKAVPRKASAQAQA